MQFAIGRSTAVAKSSPPAGPRARSAGGREGIATDAWERHAARLVEGLRQDGVLWSPAVAAAMRRVGRHRFLPGCALAEAYADRAVVVRRRGGAVTSTASQPAVVALMLERLMVAPGAHILEIGTGSGYNAALLAELTAPDGDVVTLDIDPELCAAASARLQTAPGAHVVCADGASGFPARAPYDRIVAAAGCARLPDAWLGQLTEGGLLVAPICAPAYRCVATFRRPAGRQPSEAASAHLDGAAFLTMSGAAAPRWFPSRLAGGWHGISEGPVRMDDLARLLRSPGPARRLDAGHGQRWMLPIAICAMACAMGAEAVALTRSGETESPLLVPGVAVVPRSEGGAMRPDEAPCAVFLPPSPAAPVEVWGRGPCADEAARAVAKWAGGVGRLRIHAVRDADRRDYALRPTWEADG